MATATITTKGQATIPKEIRAHLHLQPADFADCLLGVITVTFDRDAARIEGFDLPKT